MKTYWGNGGTAPLFIMWTLNGSELLASRPGSFTEGERANVTNWIGGWAGFRTGLDAVDKRKVLPRLEMNPGRPTRSPSLDRISYPGSEIQPSIRK
jgi:hypothetical protein